MIKNGMVGVVETWHHLPTASGPGLILHIEVWLKDIPNYGISKKIEQMFDVRAMMFSEHLPISQCLSLHGHALIRDYGCEISHALFGNNDAVWSVRCENYLHKINYIR